METVIKVGKEELDLVLLEKIKSFIVGVKNPEITIKITDDVNRRFFEKLDSSIREKERGETLSFTMEEFTEYIKLPK